MTSRPMMVGGLLAVALLGVFFVPACSFFDPRGRDPATGEASTLDELERARADAEAKAKREAEAEAAAAERELAALRRDAEIKLRRLDLDQQSEVLGLQAEADAAVEGVVDRLARSQAGRESQVTTLLSRYDAAIADVQQRRERAAAIVPLLEAGASAAGVPTLGLVPLIAGVLGIGGLGLAAAKSRQASSTEDAAEAVIDSMDVLKRVSPAVAQAFKDHKATIDEWQGTKGKALVERLSTAA